MTIKIIKKEVKMGILDRYLLKRDNILRKKVEIDNTLYEEVVELSKIYDASANKIINIAILGLIESENVKLYKKPDNEISVPHSLLIREELYKKLEKFREKYGISIYRLVNIAIKNVIDEENEKKI